MVNGDEYASKSEQRLLRTIPIRAPRGEIVDRNGMPLVKNRIGFAVMYAPAQKTSNDVINRDILRTVRMLLENGETIADTFPISYNCSYFLFGNDEDQAKKNAADWKKKHKLPIEADVLEVISRFRTIYNIYDDINNQDARRIIGIRYEMDLAVTTSQKPYTLVSDVSLSTVAKLQEQKADFPNVTISTTPIREYVNGSLAAHILGRVGKLSPEEMKEYGSENYTYDDIIGKQGIEKSQEKYLKGKDGINYSIAGLDGISVDEVNQRLPVQGNNVCLTLDTELQRVTEMALADIIADIKAQGAGGKPGWDAECGSIVCIDVNSGEILSMATYPTYDPARFNEIYMQLLQDKNSPLLNRAISGMYEPGSTFKMVTAIAALEENVITPYSTIRDEGVYRAYRDYTPACWIWNSSRSTHGTVNVVGALENSCNYFFYDVGRRLTIDKLNQYSRAFGLGQATGVELLGEETAGRLAGKADAEKYKYDWNPGDTLQAAIGQSKNLFTPLQLANYMATLVNGGIRYKPHLVKSIRNPRDGSLVVDNSNQIEERLDLKKPNVKAVMDGMRAVAEHGTASSTFRNFEITIGGKTGTAETIGTSNGLFVGFAPFENPQIAVAVVVEHGVHGNWTAPAVKTVMEYYLNRQIEIDSKHKYNTLY